MEIWVLLYTTEGNKQAVDINLLTATVCSPLDDDGFAISSGRPLKMQNKNRLKRETPESGNVSGGQEEVLKLLAFIYILHTHTHICNNVLSVEF